jgi:phage protein U
MYRLIFFPQETTNSTGLLKLRITDNTGNPLNDTSISSTVQPVGMRTLNAITNETGYAVFNNATAGAYTFSIVT